MAINIADYIQAVGLGLVRGYNVNGRMLVEFTSDAAIDVFSSVNWTRNAVYNCVSANRRDSTSYLDENFESIAAWTTGGAGGPGAIVNVVVSPSGDPAIGKVLNLYTGDNLNNAVSVQRFGAAAIDNQEFGVAFIQNLIDVGPAAGDALVVAVQDATVGKQIITRSMDGSFSVFYDGQYNQWLAHGGKYDTEFWVHAIKANTTQHDVGVFAGTQQIGPYRRVVLPTGPAPNNNLVVIQQLCGINVRRNSQVSVIQVGIRPLMASAVVVPPVLNLSFSPTRATVFLLVEDVSVSLDPAPGGNFGAMVSRRDKLDWANIPLTVLGDFGAGVLDNQKRLYLLGGSGNFAGPAGTQVRLGINMSRVFSPVHAALVYYG